MEDEAIWVGTLDIDDGEHLAEVSGPPHDGYQQARILVRIHGAPLGQVQVPILPAESLPSRVRAAATASLGEAMHQHSQCDESTHMPRNMRKWGAQVTCPRQFPSKGPGVTIVVCTRDRTAGLQECLRTLQQVTYDPIEILVVDNAPLSDATRQAVMTLAIQDSRVRYTCESRPGLSLARNHGMAHARFDIIAFTDDDTIVDPGWPSAVAAGFEADPETSCVTGLVASCALETRSQRYFDSRYSWGEAFEPRRYDLVTHRYPSRLYPFSAGIFGTGANFAVSRSAIARLGTFDPLLGAGSPGRGGEDLDMFLRVILGGGRICYLPSALVWHRHRADTLALGEQIYSYGYGLGAYVAKHLLNGQLPVTKLYDGFRQSAVVVGRMRRATHDSHLRSGGTQLGITEARGVVAGALRYYRSSRRAPTVYAGEQ